MVFKRSLMACLMASPAVMMAACGGDTSTASAPANASTPSKGALTLNLTDGPVDSATKVVVEFAGVSIKPAEGEPIEFTFAEPVSIDVLQLQDGAYQALLDEVEVPTGEYNWVRVFINAKEDGVLDSFIEFEDGTQKELHLPQGDEGIKIAHRFSVGEGGLADLMVDFDLRRSITHRYEHSRADLRPTLHMMDRGRSGHLRGEIEAATITELCVDPATELGAVYVFEGADAVLSDVSADAGPVTSALVKYRPHRDAYVYHVGFLPAGEYTVAYTCDAALDDPESVEELVFAEPSVVTVEARERPGMPERDEDEGQDQPEHHDDAADPDEVEGGDEASDSDDEVDGGRPDSEMPPEAGDDSEGEGKADDDAAESDDGMDAEEPTMELPPVADDESDEEQGPGKGRGDPETDEPSSETPPATDGEQESDGEQNQDEVEAPEADSETDSAEEPESDEDDTEETEDESADETETIDAGESAL